MQHLEVHLLGGFGVRVDSRDVPDDGWEHGRARQLVKLLALSPGNRLDRDRVVEVLWPDLDPEAGVANLHKAASYARKALGARDAVVLSGGVVMLAPDAEVSTDVGRFEAGQDDAYAGELLPDDRYEEWTLEHRERLRARRVSNLREAERWEDLLKEDAADEPAHRELIRASVEAGDRAAAMRQYRQLQERLSAIGMTPGPETQELISDLSRGPAVCARLPDDPPPVGRERELRLIERALDRVASGRGGLISLVGSPGIGKTRLAEAALARARDRDWHALRGSARPEEGGAPYGPMREALSPLLQQRPDLRSDLAEATVQALATLLPAGFEKDRDSASLSRHEVLASIDELLAVVARERPAIVCLEEMHAADEATIGLIQHLARASRDVRLLIVLCLRSGEERAAAKRLRSFLAEQGLGVDLRLGPLEPSAVRALAAQVTGGEVPAATAEAIERSAAGNPFFVEELAATVDDTGAVSTPDHLHEVLDARLERLDAPARELLPALTVLDDPFDPAEVAALARTDPETVVAILEGAQQTAVLESTPDGAFSFRHPLLREAARRRVSGTELEQSHAAAADYLLAADAEPERVAHHLLRAGRTREAVPMLASAARWAASVAAFGDGLGWVEEALRHADPDQRRELLALLAELRDRTGDPHAPIAYEDAVHAAAPGDRAQLRIKQARAYVAAGDVGAGARSIEAIELDALDPADRARATLTLGLIAWHRGEIELAHEHASEAGELIEKAGLTEERIQQEDLAAMVAHAEGQWGRHVHWRLGETWELPEVAGRVYDAYLCVTEYVMQAGEPYDALRDFASQLRVHAKRAGARRGEAFATTVLGEVELLSGDVEGAKGHLEEGARLAREVRATGSEATARAHLGGALLSLGDRAGAEAQIEEALGLAHHSSMAPHLLPLAHGLAIAVPADPGEAMDRVERADSILDEDSLCSFCRVSYEVAAARACARADDVERGWDFVSRAERASGQWLGWTPWSAAVAQARGELLAAEGRTAEAAASFRRAVEGFAAAGQRLNEGRAREALAAVSQPDQAAGGALPSSQ